MKLLIGIWYFEVKEKRYRIHSTENNLLGFRDEPKSLRNQYQVQNETQIRKSKSRKSKNSKNHQK